MISYTDEKELSENPDFNLQRTRSVKDLDLGSIDGPIRKLIQAINTLPFCFTLQCCYGHFVCPGQENLHNLEPLPKKKLRGKVKYRIAYLALCVQNDLGGVHLLGALKKIVQLDPKTIQYGCAGWFWTRQKNSYVLQVEPERFKTRDWVWLDLDEALQIEATRNGFFQEVDRVIQNVLRWDRRVRTD